MPSFDSIVVGEDWISEHFFTTDSTKESFQAEVIKLRKSWDEQAKGGHDTTLTRWSEARGRLQVLLAGLSEDPAGASEAYSILRRALGFRGTTAEAAFERSGTETLVPGVWTTANSEVLFVEAQSADAAEDVLSTIMPFEKVLVDGKEPKPALTVAKVVSEMYLSEQAPKYVVVMAGRWLVLTEQERWAEGRYLATDVLLVADRNDMKKHSETDRFLSIFGRDSLMPSPDGAVWWDSLLEASVKHTVGVSKDLREGIRGSIEIIANDVLKRRVAQGLPLDDVDGQILARQSLRFLYRILFLLYAEASPEMGVLPVGAGEYNEGYGLDRLRELALVNIQSPQAREGTHIYESLNGLFKLVNSGHQPEGTSEEDRPSGENEGLSFRSLEADLFRPSATSLINEAKLSNSELQRVLENLLLSKESRGKDRGFISYAELGINQLGAVYEGLMSYTGFIAEADLHEVAKDGDSEKGSWVVPVERSGAIEARHFVKDEDEQTGEKRPVVHPAGSFVFRLAGRDRQQSASYYTPEVLTKFVVSQALEELLDQGSTMTAADDILKLTVCEPALGSGAFAIETVRQLADEYLKRKQEELGERIPGDQYPQELQKVKAQIALHQVHGVDLNETAVELAEVSLWLDTMVKDLQAPWFGLRLRRGNSLIGARRATYSRQSITEKTWLKSEPQETALTGLVNAVRDETDDPNVVGRIHHFLVPAEGWGAAADAKEVKDLAGDAQKELKSWRSKIKAKPSKSQVQRLVGLGRRVESLWKLSLRRLQVAESEARRNIDYFGKTLATLDSSSKVVTRERIEQTLNDPDGAYQRLRRVMDAWNALWFWPLTDHATGGAQPPVLEDWISAVEGILGLEIPEAKATRKYGSIEGQGTVLSAASWDDLDAIESLDLSLSQAKSVNSVKVDHPWLTVCERIADEQGFFHWELDFASVFGRGGFDLQVGNPPWVRPRFDEAALLAEGDPWWQLVEKPTQAQIKTQRAQTLARDGMSEFFVDAAVTTSIVAEFLGSTADYTLLQGLQPDLYRAFMVRTWRSVSSNGAVALIHPESHFTEKRAAHLRSETYRRLRRHWQFINELSLFEIHHLVTYGVHVYGARQESPRFRMAASLYHPDTVARSEVHDGSGEVPGLKDGNGNWDTRPHAERIIEVDGTVLGVWAEILDEPGTPPVHARMVYPVNRASARVLEKLSKAPRVRELGLQYSSGWHETADRKKGYFEVGSAIPESWNDVILQGPHFTVANPFAKQPNPTMRNNLDWTEIDLEALPVDFVPRTSYQPECEPSKYRRDYGDWRADNGTETPVRDLYRIAWRRMAATTGVRTLHAAMIPPGAVHTHGVYSVGKPAASLRDLLLLEGVLSSVPVDFWVKVSGFSEINFTFLSQLPTILRTAALADEVVNRAALLSCLGGPSLAAWKEQVGDGFVPSLSALDRRQALVELDAMVALIFSLSADELCAIFRTQFPVLRGYEQNDLYDANGRKVPREINKLYRKRGEGLSLEERTWTHPQSGVEYVFEFPFQGFDREQDMRKAYAHFESLLAEKRVEELVP